MPFGLREHQLTRKISQSLKPFEHHWSDLGMEIKAKEKVLRKVERDPNFELE